MGFATTRSRRDFVIGSYKRFAARGREQYKERVKNKPVAPEGVSPAPCAAISTSPPP
jgi:hypothetical protein